ncbi:MAG: TonB-dependent receptor plug domain-containing protein, partial [Fimbriimonadaceae bacterium]|nr:TonB-dependent receptor plug domain-containing protein [Fimbriimonadaceae bacterium]
MKTIQSGVSAVAIAVAVALSTSATAQTAAPNADEGLLDEIVVTANRRAESLLDVPAAISAVTGEQLISEGVTSAKDLPNVLPNVQVGVAGFGIRGVASADFTEKGDPSTSFTVNGIYIGRFTEQQLALFDVSRVEVLRGPQGTLYGRNATAGVINVIPQRPTDT